MGKKVDLDVAHHATHYASPRDVENRFFFFLLKIAFRKRFFYLVVAANVDVCGHCGSIIGCV